jgi:hypothetical protein
MRRHETRRVAAAAAAALFLAVAAHAQVLRDLGTDDNEAQQETIQAVLNGWTPSIGAQAFKAAAPARRAALVQAALAWAKSFIQSPAFKTAYDTARSHEKPEPPTGASSYRDQLKKQREELDKTAAEMRKGSASLPPEARKNIDDTIAQMKASLDAMEKNPEQMKMMEDATAQANAGVQQEYKQKLADFDRLHPADPRAAVANQLRRFLQACGDVDFAAKLVPAQDGKRKFADAKYEAKPAEWKTCYRAGREPVEAARAVAQAWLKEIAP